MKVNKRNFIITFHNCLLSDAIYSKFLYKVRGAYKLFAHINKKEESS